jgi:S1-C subfamily serine protease
MSAEATILSRFSQSLEASVTAARELALAVRNVSHQHVSALAWEPGVVVTSEQAIGEREEYEVVDADGRVTRARIAGRDPGTNLLALRTDSSFPGSAVRAGPARTGAVALALGASFDGSTTARLGIVSAVAPQWFSRAGGRIDQRITLDIRLGRTEEGGPVVDSEGTLLGMSTLGPPGEVLVIPHATIERVIPQLLRDGHATRGWIGLGLQSVAVPEGLREAAGQSAGMMVMSIVAEGPAAKAGVKAGDILLTIDGASVRSARRLAAQLDDTSVGKQAALRLIRGGEVIALQAAVAPRPK